MREGEAGQHGGVHGALRAVVRQRRPRADVRVRHDHQRAQRHVQDRRREGVRRQVQGGVPVRRGQLPVRRQRHAQVRVHAVERVQGQMRRTVPERRRHNVHVRRSQRQARFSMPGSSDGKRRRSNVIVDCAACRRARGVDDLSKQ